MGKKHLTPVIPPTIAIAEGATSPNPGGAGAVAWSSTTSTFMVWDGSNWCSVQALPPKLNLQSGTTYTTVLADRFGIVRTSNSSGVAITIPPNSSVGYAIPTVMTFMPGGTGQITLVAGAGVTLNTSLTLKTRARYSPITATKYDTDAWDVTGDLALT